MGRCDKCGATVNWDSEEVHYGGHKCTSRSLAIKAYRDNFPNGFEPLNSNHWGDPRFVKEAEVYLEMGGDMENFAIEMVKRKKDGTL